MIGGFPWNSFVFMEFQQGGGVLEIALLTLAALGLDSAELVEDFLELAGEALAVQTEGCQGAMCGGEVEVDGCLPGRWIGKVGKKSGFEQWDAVLTPSGV